MADTVQTWSPQLQSISLPASAARGLRVFLRRRSTVAFFMCLPLIVIIGSLVIYPALYSIYLSMLNKAQTRFIGLGNFRFLLSRDVFLMVVQQTAIFALSAVFFKALIGLITAHLINNLPLKGQRKWRGMLLVPWVIPLALSTLGWWWMFDPTHSALNWMLESMGFGSVPWLSNPYWARLSVILVNVWYGAPFFLIMYLAALKSVPEQLYEAAAIDGANAWQKFVHITLPMMRNIIAITVLFSLIVTFANFDIVQIMTSGGPRNMTHVFATYAFLQGIRSGDLPLGASVSLFMFPILGIAARQGDRMSTAAVAESAPGHVAAGSSLRRNRRWALIASYVFLIIFAIFFLIPPYYMIVTALKTDTEVAHLATNPWFVANGITFEQFRALFTETDFLVFFKNTVIVTVCVVAITMVVSVLAAFSLGRMRFWGSGILATGIFLTYLIPDTLLFIPLFQIVKAIGLLNSYWGMVLVYPTLTVPFCTWIMIGYFQSIPKELDEAALIDGANHMQMLTKIFIPVALPGIIAAMIFAFTVSWAAFVYPMAFLYSADQQVLTVGTVTSLIRADVYKWGMLMAGALTAAAPPLIIYAFLMDYYIAGLTAGATKG